MNRVTVLTKWTNDGGTNIADVVLRFATPGSSWSDDTGQRDDQISPDPNIVVFYGEVDGPVVDALEADADVIVLTSDEIIIEAPAARQTPEEVLQSLGVSLDSPTAQKFLQARADFADVMREEGLTLVEDLPTVEAQAVVKAQAALKPPDANPTAAERTKLVNWLNAQGVTGADRAALVRAGVSRKTIADDIRAWAKERPKAGG